MRETMPAAAPRLPGATRRAARPGPGHIALAVLTAAVAVFDLSLARNHLLGVTGDDSYYLTLAQALATGHGFVVPSLPWTPPETSVPPGFPLLLAPLVALTSTHAEVLRLVPLVFGVAATPLTWAYLRQLGLPFPAPIAGAALVGFNPILGLYATIVTPETACVCALLALLICVARWSRTELVSPWGAGAVAAALALFELKLAAVLLLASLVGYLFLVARRRTRALVLAAALAVAGLPLLVTRLLSGTSLAGTTYGADFSNGYGAAHGAALVLDVLGTALRNLAALLYPTLVETVTGLAPVPLDGGMRAMAAAAARDGLLAGLSLAMLAGAVLLWRRARDTGTATTAGYLLLVTIFPIMNTRRVILVLPVVVAWLLVGLVEVYRRMARRAPARLSPDRWRIAVAALLAGAVALPTMGVNVHDWRDYRSDWTVQLLPDRPWIRYLGQEATPTSLVEVLYPRQLYLSTGVHADSSLWLACAEVGRQRSRAPFDEVLSQLRPEFVVAAGTPLDCVPEMIRGDPEYRQVFSDPADHVVIWRRGPP